MLTCGEGQELSSHSQHGTQQAFVRRKPEDIGVYDLPAVVSLVQIVAAALFLHVVPAAERKDAFNNDVIMRLTSRRHPERFCSGGEESLAVSLKVHKGCGEYSQDTQSSNKC